MTDLNIRKIDRIVAAYKPDDMKFADFVRSEYKPDKLTPKRTAQIEKRIATEYPKLEKGKPEYTAMIDKLYKVGVQNSLASRLTQIKKRIMDKYPQLLNPVWDKVAIKSTWKSDYDKWMQLPLHQKYLKQLEVRKRGGEPGFDQAIREYDVLPPNLQALKLEHTEGQERKENLNTRKKELDGNKMELNGNDTIATLHNLESSRGWNVLAALVLATGRRLSEIIKFGTFEPWGDYAIRFSGQLKSGLNKKQSYIFPTLAKSEYIIKRINRLREVWDDQKLTADEIDEQISGWLNAKTVKKIYGPGMTVRKLRGAYAMLADRIYNPDSDPKDEERLKRYIATILGDETRNAPYYMRFNITNFDNPHVYDIKHPENPKPILDQDDKFADIKDKVVEEVKPVKAEPTINLKYKITTSDINKREAIQELVRTGKKITAAAIHRLKKGQMSAISKFIEKNKEEIDRYNATIDTK